MLIDKEIELPAGAIRVAPLEETRRGLIVISRPRSGMGDRSTDSGCAFHADEWSR